MAKKTKKSPAKKKTPAKKAKPKAAPKKKPPAKSAPASKPAVITRKGDVVWNELQTPDQTGALSFYQKLFGWKSKPMGAGPAGAYQILSQAGRDFGGVMKAEDPSGGAYWLTYFWADNTDKTVQQVTALGGKVIAPPMDIAGAGRIAVVADPSGAVFALLNDPNYKP